MTRKVSVVVPVFNGEQFIGECVESVLDQDHGDFELLIVDDGSSDKTASVVQQFADRDSRVRLLHHEDGANLGVSKSRRLGIETATGQWVAFLDADDRFLQQKLSKQMTAMEGRDDLVMSHTGVLRGTTIEDADANNSWSILAFQLGEYVFNEKETYLEQNPVCLSSTLVRKDALLNLDLAFPQLYQLEDWVMWILLSTQGKFLALPEQLTFYRQHADQFMAGYMGNPLIEYAGSVEMCLVLLSRVGCPRIEQQLKDRLGVLLYEMSEIYSSQSSCNMGSVLEESPEVAFWKERARKAENGWSQLILKAVKRVYRKILSR